MYIYYSAWINPALAIKIVKMSKFIMVKWKHQQKSNNYKSIITYNPIYIHSYSNYLPVLFNYVI